MSPDRAGAGAVEEGKGLRSLDAGRNPAGAIEE